MKPYSYSRIFVSLMTLAISRRLGAYFGRLLPIKPTLERLNLAPSKLNLELTNICNANCIFCGYQYQQRPSQIMSDATFNKALSDYVAMGGGDVSLTPLVGEATVDPQFLERIRVLRDAPSIKDISVITNGILLDRFNTDAIVESGLSRIFISTAGFEKSMYERLYRTPNYERMYNNVLALLQARKKHKSSLDITIGLRSDRSLADVSSDPDFQEILTYRPRIDYTWHYADFGGRITQKDLRGTMQLRILRDSKKSEPCKRVYDGPTVLPDGEVIICSCSAAMDALSDLRLGSLAELTLAEMWTGHARKQLIDQFTNGPLNKTCRSCTSYESLDYYRMPIGRIRARRVETRVKRLRGK